MTPARRAIRISTGFAPKYHAKQVTTKRTIIASNATQLALIAQGPPALTAHLAKTTPTWPIINALPPAQTLSTITMTLTGFAIRNA